MFHKIILTALAVILLAWLAACSPTAQHSNTTRYSERRPAPEHEAPAPSLQDAIDERKVDTPLTKALDALLKGNLAFNAPDKLTLGRTQVLQAKLSVAISGEQLKAALEEAGKKESATLLVGDRMAATLSGGSAFDVSPSGMQEQFIDRQSVTTWTWEVTAKASGAQQLVLSFDAVLNVDGKDGLRNVTTLIHQIDVEVGWPQTPGEWFDYFKKVVEDVSWLWTTLLVPLIALVVWWRKRSTPKS